MSEKKDPRITVIASAALLEQLLNADTALKASRMKPERKVAGCLHALIVQVTSVRERGPREKAAARLGALNDLPLIGPLPPRLPPIEYGPSSEGEALWKAAGVTPESPGE